MHLQCTMSSIFDWEVSRLGMRERVKTRTDNVFRIWIFHKNCRFLWGKKCFKDKRKYNTLYLYYVIYQIFPTLYGFRGVAAQWNRSLPVVLQTMLLISADKAQKQQTINQCSLNFYRKVWCSGWDIWQFGSCYDGLWRPVC